MLANISSAFPPSEKQGKRGRGRPRGSKNKGKSRMVRHVSRELRHRQSNLVISAMTICPDDRSEPEEGAVPPLPKVQKGKAKRKPPLAAEQDMSPESEEASPTQPEPTSRVVAEGSPEASATESPAKRGRKFAKRSALPSVETGIDPAARKPAALGPEPPEASNSMGQSSEPEPHQGLSGESLTFLASGFLVACQAAKRALDGGIPVSYGALSWLHTHRLGIGAQSQCSSRGGASLLCYHQDDGGKRQERFQEGCKESRTRSELEGEPNPFPQCPCIQAHQTPASQAKAIPDSEWIRGFCVDRASKDMPLVKAAMRLLKGFGMN
ncbi:hypothetical protein AVDCRST_MAG94-4763 [uncultured Leptolyngbya sp.]|uniref:Uncharacterized protein n=1 Tax=uncultured Leptolyngbya sp. TaxID=332963 RepID=A0A6J4N9S0_9CYAN|nr:hypothetical protein AVDCRST_MAG94-4763 [uncultured Leptolyngbya sp.]